MWWTFLIFAGFQGRSGGFLWDLPGFRPFSRKVRGFSLGPSRFSALFKEGPEGFRGTFQGFGPFQGRSGGFPGDLPGFRPFLRKVRGPARSGLFQGFPGGFPRGRAEIPGPERIKQMRQSPQTQERTAHQGNVSVSL